MLQDVFSIESKDNRWKCSSCRLRGQKSKLSYRHAELGAVKVKIGTFRPAPGPQKRENKNAFLFFPFHCNRINRDSQDSGLCNLEYSIAIAEIAFHQEFIFGHTTFEIPFKWVRDPQSSPQCIWVYAHPICLHSFPILRAFTAFVFNQAWGSCLTIIVVLLEIPAHSWGGQ